MSEEERLTRGNPTHPRTEEGLNVVGFFEVESGLGEIARRLVRAVASAGVPVAPIAYRGTLGRGQHPHGLALVDDAPFDTNLICLSADDLVRFGAQAGSAFFERRYSVGVWFWETDVFRDEDRAAARFLDELWVASDYIRRSVASKVEIPVRVVPVPVEAPPATTRTRAELGLPDGFTFLFVFDYWSGERKNPGAVVEAFSKAFAPGEGPVLVLKSIHGRDWRPDDFAAVAALAGGRDDVLLHDGYVSAAERDAYVAACDCYVSLHRSEGLGLTIAEAMARAKPVIATGYSGNLELAGDYDELLVPYRLVDVPETWWAHVHGATWAEPDIDAAARLMRQVWAEPERAHAIGRACRDAVLERFTPERTAAFVVERLADARRRGLVGARTSDHDARPPILDVSQSLEEAGVGDALAAGPRLHPTSVVRRVLRRALWPHLEAERRVQQSVLDALGRLHRSVDDLEARVIALESERGDERP